jgi:uncharacterized protein
MDKVKPIARVKGKKWLSLFTIATIAIVVLIVFFFKKDSGPLTRPQEPKGPFPYKMEDVKFLNSNANITLDGTLTLPSEQREPYAAVVLISGYGPQNRDGEWIGHKPFLIIADHLTRLGFAVLRYDDRGAGKSGGDYHASTSLDFATDVESAVKFLKSRVDIDSNRIGLIGHSDGAMIAPIVATRSNDIGVIVMLAGPGINVGELMVKRQEMIERKLGKTEADVQKSVKYMERLINIITTADNDETLKSELNNFANSTSDEIPDDQIPPGMTKEEFINRQVAMLGSPFFKFAFSYDPSTTLKNVKCPVLAITGDKDVQAPSNINLPAIERALHSAGNTDVTIRELNSVNHMFQECNTGMMDEYAIIEQTFSPLALREISKWLVPRLRIDTTFANLD